MSNAGWLLLVGLGVFQLAILLVVPLPGSRLVWIAVSGVFYLALIAMAVVQVVTQRQRLKRAAVSLPGTRDGTPTWRLSVRRWGETGPTIVLLHGLGGSALSWRSTAEALNDRFRVIAPDLLGFGRSPWPNIAYTMDDHLDALDATLILEGLGPGGILLGGHSAGAILALAWAGRHPDWFAGLMLAALPRYESPQEARVRVAGLGPLAYATVARPWLGAAICGAMCVGRPLWRLVMPRLMPELPPEVARDGMLHIWESYSRTLTHCVLEVDLTPMVDQLLVGGLPVSLVHGECDREAPVEGVAQLAHTTGWPLAVIADAHHFLPSEQPGACAAAIRALASRVHADERQRSGSPATT